MLTRPASVDAVPLAKLHEAIAAGGRQLTIEPATQDGALATLLSQQVVVTDMVTTPTWVRHPEMRGQAMCLLVPGIDRLTRPLCSQLTGVIAPYFTVREARSGEVVATITTTRTP